MNFNGFDDISVRGLLPGNSFFRTFPFRQIGPDETLNVTFDFQLSVPANGIFPQRLTLNSRQLVDIPTGKLTMVPGNCTFRQGDCQFSTRGLSNSTGNCQ